MSRVHDLGLFKKKPIDNWIDDLMAVVDSDSKMFKEAVKVKRNMYAVVLINGREGMVGCANDSIYFTMTLENIGDIGKRCGLEPSVAYRRLMSLMSATTLGVDENLDLHVSAMVPENYYDSFAMMDQLYRWVYNMIDYETAVKKLCASCGGDAQ